MARIITAPEVFNWESQSEYGIFLAGAIDMGAAVDWQAYAIEKLRVFDHLAILNPRRANFSPDTLDEQIFWELHALEAVDTVLMWFPKDAKAPISFFEAGLYWGNSLVVGAEHGFYRRRNLELAAGFFNQLLCDTLDQTIQEAVKRYLGHTQY